MVTRNTEIEAGTGRRSIQPSPEPVTEDDFQQSRPVQTTIEKETQVVRRSKKKSLPERDEQGRFVASDEEPVTEEEFQQAFPVQTTIEKETQAAALTKAKPVTRKQADASEGGRERRRGGGRAQDPSLPQVGGVPKPKSRAETREEASQQPRPSRLPPPTEFRTAGPSPSLSTVKGAVLDFAPVTGSFRQIKRTVENFPEASNARRALDTFLSTLSVAGDAVLVGGVAARGGRAAIRGITGRATSGGNKVVISVNNDAPQQFIDAALAAPKSRKVIDVSVGNETVVNQVGTIAKASENLPAVRTNLTVQTYLHPQGAKALSESLDIIRAADIKPVVKVIIDRPFSQTQAREAAELIAKSKPGTVHVARQYDALIDTIKQRRAQVKDFERDLKEATGKGRVLERVDGSVVDEETAIRAALTVHKEVLAATEALKKGIDDTERLFARTLNVRGTRTARTVDRAGPVKPDIADSARVETEVVFDPSQGGSSAVPVTTLPGHGAPTIGTGRLSARTSTQVPNSDLIVAGGTIGAAGRTIPIRRGGEGEGIEDPTSPEIGTPTSPETGTAPFDPFQPIEVFTEFPEIVTPREPAGEPETGDLPGPQPTRTTPPSDDPGPGTTTTPTTDDPTITDPGTPGRPFGGTFTPPAPTPTGSPGQAPRPEPKPEPSPQPRAAVIPTAQPTGERISRTTKRPPRTDVDTFELPTGRRLQPGEFPEVVDFQQGIVGIRLNLFTGETQLHKVPISRARRDPKDTFRVVTVTDRRPPARILPFGIADVIVTERGLSFRRKEDLERRREFGRNMPIRRVI